jgi:hypothetical protein
MSKKKVASGLMRVRLQLTFNNGQLELAHELPFVPRTDFGLFGLPGLSEGGWGFFPEMMEWDAFEKEFLVIGRLSGDLDPSDTNTDWTTGEDLDGKFANKLRAAGWE